MNKYTPTLAQVRDFWASDGNLQPAVKSYEYGEGCTEFDRFIAKVKADALREAANALPKPVGLGCNPECHTVDWASLRGRADRIEAGEA